MSFLDRFKYKLVTCDRCRGEGFMIVIRTGLAVPCTACRKGKRRVKKEA